MFAQLGNIQFNLITYFNFLEEKKKKGYSEQKRLQGKPILQKIADEADRITIQMKFHKSFCNPETEFNKIKEAANADEALPFVYGSGTYQGNYVIEAIKSNIKQADSEGRIIAIEADIELLEAVEDNPIVIKKIKKKAQAPAIKSTSNDEEYRSAIRKYALKKLNEPNKNPYSGNIQDYINSTDEEKNVAIYQTILRSNVTDKYYDILTKPKPSYISEG